MTHAWFGKKEEEPKPETKIETVEPVSKVSGTAPDSSRRTIPGKSPTPILKPISNPDEIEDLFVEEVYDWVGGVRAKTPQFRGDRFHVSSLSNMCSRKVIFAEMYPELDVEDVIPAWLQMTFDFGSASHDWWQNKYFGPMGWLFGNWRCSRCRNIRKQQFQPKDPCVCGWVQKEEDRQGNGTTCRSACRWPGGYEAEDRNCSMCTMWGSWEYLEPRIDDPELDLVGNCDGHLIIPEGKLQGVTEAALEAKTITKGRFDSLRGPIPNHVFQINTYMHYMGLSHGIILYIQSFVSRIDRVQNSLKIS